MTIKIMLDPGHAGDYFNQSPVVPDYYESAAMWKLCEKLKKALVDRGFEVGITRYHKSDDPELTVRGRRAIGCDLFLSLHSNAAASPVPDAPWMIHFKPDGKTTLDEKSEDIAHALGNVISKVMGVSAPLYYTKGVDFDRDGNGFLDDEYYGVLFGAKSVGVPAVIIEHSFHTNERAAAWLLKDENLDKLAEAEADALAKYYGLEDDDMQKKYEELKAYTEKLGERLEMLETQVKPKWAYIDSTLEKDAPWAVETMKKLAKRGILKGNEKNSFEMSRLMMRILVMLDRAQLFN